MPIPITNNMITNKTSPLSISIPMYTYYTKLLSLNHFSYIPKVRFQINVLFPEDNQYKFLFLDILDTAYSIFYIVSYKNMVAI